MYLYIFISYATSNTYSTVKNGFFQVDVCARVETMVVTYLVARACDRDWPDGLSVVKAWLDGHHPDEEIPPAADCQFERPPAAVRAVARDCAFRRPRETLSRTTPEGAVRSCSIFLALGARSRRGWGRL